MFWAFKNITRICHVAVFCKFNIAVHCIFPKQKQKVPQLFANKNKSREKVRPPTDTMYSNMTKCKKGSNTKFFQLIVSQQLFLLFFLV